MMLLKDAFSSTLAKTAETRERITIMIDGCTAIKALMNLQVINSKMTFEVHRTTK